MPGKKILWLCSWYPNKVDPFNGDFIQRHAQAASLLNNISVIFVQSASESKTEINPSDAYKNLTEKIIFVNKSGTKFSGKIITHLRWLTAFRKAIDDHISQHGLPDLVHVHVPMKAGVLALWALKKYKVKYLVTEHWGIYNDVASHNFQEKSIFFKHYTRKIFQKAAVFISVSNFLGNGVNREVIKKPFVVMPNVVDTTKFFYKEKNKSEFTFLHVSNMDPIKNPYGIIDAFDRFITTGGEGRLIMVGNSDPVIRQHASNFKISSGKISFIGEVPYESVANQMQSANALLLFSNMENSPCVIGEALCCGLPVIATNAGGIPELTDPGNSILVDIGNVTQLAAAMHLVINEYAKYNLARIAEMASVRFSYLTATRKFDDIYNNVEG